MNDYLCFAIALAILLLGLITAYRNRHTTSRCISCILLGVMLSEIFMVLPTQWLKQGESIYNEEAYRVLYSIVYGFDSIKGDINAKQLETIGLAGWMRDLYFILNYILYFAIPLLTSSLLISFFADMGDRMRYAFRFTRKCHVFSELNENSLSLAKGIRKKDRNTTLVFCGTKGVEENMAAQIKKLGGILIHRSCENFRIGFKHRNYTFYLIAQDEDRNTRMAERIISKHKALRKGKLTVNAFAESGTNINVIESMDKGNICLRFIDEISLFCNHLLFENPLYQLPEGRKDISVLIVGCGRMGMQMVKTVAWCGQMAGHELHVRVVDKDAQARKNLLYAQCPELALEEYDIQFYQGDIQSPEFDRMLAENFDPTFVVVATGDDELNLSTADRIRAALRRKECRFRNDPAIFARVRSGIKTENLTCSGNNYLSRRNIRIFGSTESVFAHETLFNTTLERLALAVHLSYSGAIDAEPTDKVYQDACYAFETSEYSRRSSMATALHIPVKLYGCGILDKNHHDLTEAVAGRFEQLLQSQSAAELDKMAIAEHIRWNAFIRSEGYRCADQKTMEAYVSTVGHQRDDLSKLHPCLVDWMQLDNVASAYNNQMHTQKDFKDSDRQIIERIPRIIRFHLQKDSFIG